MAEPEHCSELLVDPAVSRAKFERELGRYREREEEYRRRGCWLLTAEFPEIFVVFATPQTTPPAVVCGAVLDFTNYDFWPPSVRLVSPFTRVPYRAKELPTLLLRRTTLPVVAPEGLAALGLPAGVEWRGESQQPLMQFYDPDEVPFLCLPGVREYHNHPAHSHDPWLRHRGGGEGTLHFLLEQLYRYGVAPISGFQVQLVPQVSFTLADVAE